MATQLASIGVGKLSSTAKYVAAFIVEIYSDAGYTVRIGQQTATAQWNGSAWVQKDSIIFGGLVFGTTYYLRAAVIAPLTGAFSAWTTFNTAAGSASAPGCTYSGTFVATTSGIGYVVTPASIPTDIDHYEAVWQFDATVPSNTTISYWSGQTTNGVISFFVGGTPGQVAKVYVRAVNTSQQAQAWQLIDTRTVSSTWSFTTTGTIGDGTLLGTGGPAVNSGSTGRLGIGGTQDASNFLTTFGGYVANKTAGNAGYWSYDTSASPATFVTITNRASGGYFVQDNGAGINRSQLNMSGQYSVGGAAISDSILSATGSTGGAPGRFRISGSDSFLGVSGTTPAQAYGFYNTSGVLHNYNETSATHLTYLNSGGSFGVGGSPSNKLNVFGGNDDGLLISNPEPSVFYADTTVGSRQYQQYGLSNNFSVWDNTAASNRLILNNSGQYGIDATPSAPLYVAGTTIQVQAANPYLNAVDTTPTTGTSYFFQSSGGNQLVGQTGVNTRLTLNSSGQYGIGATPTNPLYLSGDAFWHIGPSASNVNQGTNVGGRTFETATGAAHAMLDGQYGWNDVTAGTNRTLLNSSGQYGIGGAPGNIFDIHGGQYATISAGSGGWHTVDTNASGISAYFLSGNVAAGNISINRDGTGNVAQWNSNGMGVGITPNQALTVATGFLGVNLQGTQPSVIYTDTGNTRNWSFGARGGPQLEMADETAGLGRTYLSTGGGYGIGSSGPGSDFNFANSNRSYFTGTGPGIAVNDTQASGRLYMMLSGSGQAQGYQIYNGTNANYPLMIDNSARTGLGAMTPADPLSVSGNTRSYGSNAGVWISDRTSGAGYAFYGASSIPRLFAGSADFATFNPSTGAMGLGGTYTGDWISIQGTPVIASDKNLYNQIKISGKARGLADVTDMAASGVGQNIADNPSFDLAANPGTGDVVAGWYASGTGWTISANSSNAAQIWSGTQSVKLSLNANLSVPANSSVESDLLPRKLLTNGIKQGQKYWVRIKVRSDASLALTTGLSVRCGIACIMTETGGTGTFIGPTVAGINELAVINGAFVDKWALLTVPNPVTAGNAVISLMFYIYAVVTNSTGAAVSTPNGLACDFSVDNVEIIRTVETGSDEILKVGSVPQNYVGTLSYGSTTSSIAWSWSLTISRIDSTMSVQSLSGSQTVTGLSSGTSYNFYPFYDEGTLSGTTGVTMVTTGGTGTPTWAHSGTSVAWTQEQTRADHTPLSTSPLAASTTSTGTGGGSGGGSGGVCHRSGTFVKERTRGVIHLEDARPDDYLWSENDTWIRVKSVQKQTHDLWIPITFNCGQKWFATAGHPYILRDRTIKRGYELSLMDEIPCTTGITHPTAMSVVNEEHEVVKIEMEEPHTFYAATLIEKPWVLSHNYNTL